MRLKRNTTSFSDIPFSSKSSDRFVYPATEKYSNQYGSIAGNVETIKHINTGRKFKIRLCQPSTGETGQKYGEDYKLIEFYLTESYPKNFKPRVGDLWEWNNNIYICDNPHIAPGVIYTANIKRCNTVWNIVDYYGNIVSIPMAKETVPKGLGSNEKYDTANLARFGFSCTIPYNETTKHLQKNDRVILGGQAFATSLYNNFTRQETFDKNSVGMVTFLLYSVPSIPYDDLINDIVERYAFSWKINLSQTNIKSEIGEKGKIEAISTRNNVILNSVLDSEGYIIDEKTESKIISEIPQKPYSYIWESSDLNIVTVDDKGNYECIGIGEAIITCYLAENKNKEIKSECQIKVETVPIVDNYYIKFEPMPINTLYEGENQRLEAFLYNGSIKTQEEIKFDITSSTPQQAYSIYDIKSNSCMISCNYANKIPIVLEASAKYTNGIAKSSIEIRLLR